MDKKNIINLYLFCRFVIKPSLAVFLSINGTAAATKTIALNSTKLFILFYKTNTARNTFETWTEMQFFSFPAYLYRSVYFVWDRWFTILDPYGMVYGMEFTRKE